MLTTILAAIAGAGAAAIGHATQTAIKKCIDSNESKLVTEKIPAEEDILYKKLDEDIQRDDISDDDYKEHRIVSEECILYFNEFCRRCASWRECDNKPQSFLCNKLMARGNCYRCRIDCFSSCTYCKHSWGSQECLEIRYSPIAIAKVDRIDGSKDDIEVLITKNGPRVLF